MLSEYVDELKQYSPTYTQWAGSEEELAESLNGVANCLVRCSKETEEQIYHLSEVLVPTLHEYVLCAETLKVSPDHTAISDLLFTTDNKRRHLCSSIY